MNDLDDCRTYAEHLRIEHSHIDRSLEELQHLLGKAVDEKQHYPEGELLAKLVQLQENLVHHFREEEEGGCLEEAQSRSPCLSADVRELQARHAGFLQKLHVLIAQAQSLANRPQGRESLQAVFAEFLHELHAHEAEENRILLFGFGSTAMESCLE